MSETAGVISSSIIIQFTRIQAIRIHPVQDELMILAIVNSTSVRYFKFY